MGNCSIERIWNTDEGEAHFDCSRYHVRYFEWINGKLERKNEYTTKYKYLLEEDKKYNQNGESFTKDICITTHSFSSLISHLRSDAVNAIYPQITLKNNSSPNQNNNSIIQQDVNLRESPNTSAKVIRPLIKGESVLLIGSLNIESQIWFNIKSIQGETGWISEIGFKKDDSVESAIDSN